MIERKIESKIYKSNYSLCRDLNDHPEWKIISITDSIVQYKNPQMIDGNIVNNEHNYTLFYEVRELSIEDDLVKVAKKLVETITKLSTDDILDKAYNSNEDKCVENENYKSAYTLYIDTTNYNNKPPYFSYYVYFSPNDIYHVSITNKDTEEVDIIKVNINLSSYKENLQKIKEEDCLFIEKAIKKILNEEYSNNISKKNDKSKFSIGDIVKPNKDAIKRNKEFNQDRRFIITEVGSTSFWNNEPIWYDLAGYGDKNTLYCLPENELELVKKIEWVF